MRGLRSLILLLIIALPLGWFAYRDYQKPAGDDGPKKDKVFAVESDKIDEIAVKSESGERTQLSRARNGRSPRPGAQSPTRTRSPA